jgi:uncharacterized protein involved in exopolysaccharide biosynthesis
MNTDMHDYNPSLRYFAELLFKRKQIVIGVFAFIVLASCSVFLLPSKFQADAKILIEKELITEKELLFRTSLSGQTSEETWINSEIEIIKSKPVAERAMIRCGLLDTARTPSGSIQANKAIEKFLKSVQIEKSRNSNVLDITYEDEAPELARKAVDALLQSYIAYRAEIHDDSESYHFFSDQVRIADANLREMENRLSVFKQTQGIISPDAQRQILIGRLADFGKTLTDLRTQRFTREMRLAVLKRQMESGSDDLIPSVQSSDITGRDKYISKLKSDLLDMNLAKDRLLQQYKPDYEEVVNLDGQIAATKQMIAREISQVIDSEQMMIQSLVSEEKLLENAIANTNGEIKDFARKEYQFAQYSRGIDDNREVYSMLLKQMEEARISLAKIKKGINIKVINPAELTPDPVKPKRKLFLLLGIFIGLMAAVSAAVAVEYFSPTISSPQDLELVLGSASLGTIQHVRYQTIYGSDIAPIARS